MKLVAATLIAMVASWCCAAFVGMGFNWGYELVKNLAGQPESDQAVIAAMTLYFVVLPFSFAFILGCLKKAWNGSAIWNCVPALGVVLAGAFDVIADGTLADLIEVAPWLLVALATSYAALWAGQKIAANWSGKFTGLALVTLFGAALPAGIIEFSGVNLDYRLEMLVFVLSLSIGSAIVANYQRNQVDRVSFKQAMVWMLPVLAPLALNFVATCLAVLCDQCTFVADLGWRSLVSSASIALAATAAVGIGLLIQSWQSQFRLVHRVGFGR